MNRTYQYKVAGFRFSVQIPASLDMNTLLPSFLPFRSEEEGNGIFRMEALHTSLPEDETAVLLEESVNDMGYTRLMRTANGYRISLCYTEGGAEHWMRADDRFTQFQAVIDWNDPLAGMILGSLLRIAYSQAVVYHRAVSIHASVVMLDGKGFLFMGKSGTGKSTHSALWMKTFVGCELLNDDNPTIRLTEEGVMVYGTPWSGKTPCYKNMSCPLAGMVRLRQAKENRFIGQKEIAAFITVLPGCSVIRKDEEHYDALCATLVDMVGKVRTGVMECLPDRDAAIICRTALDKK